VKNCPKLNFNPKEFFRCCCVANWKTIYHVLIPFSFMLKLYFKKCCCNTNLSAWHSESRGPNRVPHAPPLWYTHKLGKKWTVVTSSECESFLSFFFLVLVFERRHAGHYEVRWTGRMWKLRVTRLSGAWKWNCDNIWS
jgi:hypothetical protein